ncbi:MAG: hypothetical protein IPJ40_06165 [Saprospirales bacterium]|nr:hypothetical protein [Saprospirales bacterium]
MKIAEFKWLDNTFEQDKNYIPPCFTISSHPELSSGINGSEAYSALCWNSVRNWCTITGWIPGMMCVTAPNGWKCSSSSLAGSIWTYNDLLPERSPVYTMVYLKNWIQYVLITASVRRNNPMLANNLEALQPFFKQIAKDKFDYHDLRHAFDRWRSDRESVSLVSGAWKEPFRKSFVPKVED